MPGARLARRTRSIALVRFAHADVVLDWNIVTLVTRLPAQGR
jgi:hypothetical protein